MTHSSEPELHKSIPSPVKFLAWATAPATLAVVFITWISLRPPPTPWQISVATACVVTAGAAGIVALAALMLFVAKGFADRYNAAEEQATKHQQDIGERLSRIEEQQRILASHLISHGAEITRLNDREQEIYKHAKRLAQGVDDLRQAYIEEGAPAYCRVALSSRPGGV